MTPEQLVKIRKRIPAGNWNKSTINTAIDTIDDLFNGVKASWSSAINDATAPFTFTNAQKKLIFAYWLLEKYNIEVE